jgi:hypothetical protein
LVRKRLRHLREWFLLQQKEDESDQRMFTRAKSNISVDDGGFHYTIQETSTVKLVSQSKQLALFGAMPCMVMPVRSWQG